VCPFSVEHTGQPEFDPRASGQPASIQCLSCQHSNPADFSFCQECANPLKRSCPSCGASASPIAKFCGKCAGALDELQAKTPPASERSPLDYTPKHLADKILQSKSALEGERKQVTVLFVDVKGSMDLAEQLGAEQWHGVLDRFFQILAEGVHRFEGTINQYTGDGIMALFGAPIAHENHAQRACYAALQLRDEITHYATDVKREFGLGFSMRMGIHSGEVVVGTIGDDLRMDYTAQGHTVGLAQRMEALASSDTCYLTAATAALVAGYFDLEDLGEFQVKGAREPVRVHQLIGPGAVRTRFDLSRARGLTRFVGRDADMASLENALAQAQAGNGQIVGVVAEAGTGKSRLCYEFIELCRDRGMTILEGHALAHGKNIPSLPMLEVFRAYYGIAEQDDDRTVREKIAGRLLLIDEDFRETLPVMFEFFGVPDPERPVETLNPDAKRRQLFAVLRRLVQSGPGTNAYNSATLIEDLHWLDPASEAFLEQWVEAIADSPSFLLLNFRPEYKAAWMRKPYYQQLTLTPLGPEAIRDLLADLLGTDSSMQDLTEMIYARSGGNPFFTEEIVQGLIDSGQLEGERRNYRLATPIEHLDLPASVRDVLAARIDLLAEPDKRVLQAAAVIGKEFSEPILLSATELPAAELRAALAALRSGEFVYERALYPIAEYAFKHPLTQEVALGSQLQQRRLRTHATVARAIEDVHADKLEEHAALLAHHWEQAEEAFTAARWHHRAAEWIGRNDAVQALRHMQRVLALTTDLEESAERSELRLEACRSLLLVSGWSLGLSREERELIFAEGLALAKHSGDVGRTVDLHVGYALGLGMAGEIRAYYEGALKAAALVDESVSRGTAALVLGGLSYSLNLLGRFGEGLNYLEQLASLTEGDPVAGIETAGLSAWIYTFQARAWYYAILGRLDEAQALVREGLRLARLHDKFTLSAGLATSVEVADWCGHRPPSPDADQAQQHALEGVQVAEQGGTYFIRIDAHRGLAMAHLLQGQWRAATDVLEEALASMREQQTALEREALFLALLARAKLGMGDAVGARSTARQAVECAQRQGARFFECMGEVEQARALLAAPGVSAGDEIEASLARALSLVEETGGRVLEPQIIEEQARLAAMRGDTTIATEHLRTALALYLEIGATGHAERLTNELDG